MVRGTRYAGRDPRTAYRVPPAFMPEQRESLEPEHIMNNDAPVVSDIGESDIQTIPDKYYGAALRASFENRSKSTASKAAGGKSAKDQGKVTQRRHAKPIIIGIVVIVLLAGGAFAYFNQPLLFGKNGAPPPQTATTTPPVAAAPSPSSPPPVPAAPSNLEATSTSPTLTQLIWQDHSNNEAGFRIERRDSSSDYRAITSVPPNSTVYQDTSVAPQTSYLYRVIAVNEGGDSPASNEVSVATPAEPPLPPEQPKLPPAGLDSDSDGLSDLEEALFHADPHNPDTDKDSFLDGNEVFHLYNPAGGGNALLIDSGEVKVFASAAEGWSMYVPTSWKTSLNSDESVATSETGHGETFVVSILRNDAKQSLMDWYLTNHLGELSSEVAMIETKSGLKGIEGKDLLTTYFAWGDQAILSFEYKLDGQPFVNFRNTYEMMKNSLLFRHDPTPPVVSAAPPATSQEASTTSETSPVVPAPQPVMPIPSPGDQSASASDQTTSPADAALSNSPPPIVPAIPVPVPPIE
jgi:hypothetical protein